MRNLYAERQQEPILPGYSYWEIEDSHSLGEVVDEDKDKEEK